MEDTSALSGALEKTSGRRRIEPSTPEGLQDVFGRLELVARLQAIVYELGLLDADLVDVPRTLGEGLLEDVERELANRLADGARA
jgi:hypothetical protein